MSDYQINIRWVCQSCGATCFGAGFNSLCWNCDTKCHLKPHDSKSCGHPDCGSDGY